MYMQQSGLSLTMLFLIVILCCSLPNISAHCTCPKCGNMDVPYPLSTRDNCGNSQYRVSCNNNVLEFVSAQGFHYKILSINPDAYKMILQPPRFVDHTCLSGDLLVGGLTLDENSPFNISTHNTVMLFNCSTDILLAPLNCSLNSPCRIFEEKVARARGCKGTLCCSYLKDSAMTSHRIRIRVGGCTAYTCIVDFKGGDRPKSWNYGVEVQWLPLPN